MPINPPTTASLFLLVTSMTGDGEAAANQPHSLGYASRISEKSGRGIRG